MRQRNKLILDKDDHIKSSMASKEQKKYITYLLEEGSYVTGYIASLIYIMNKLAKIVYIVGSITKKEHEILKRNCEISSVPLYEIPHSIVELQDIDVLTIVANTS